MEEKTEERNKEMITEPDENGVRYYTIGERSGASEAFGTFGGGGSTGGSGGDGGQKKRVKKPFLIFLCILAGVIFLAAGCNALGTGDSSEYADMSKDHISVLHIEGTISGTDSSDALSVGDGYNHQWTMARLDDVIHNPSSRGLILFVNTPGGSVYETDELYLKIKEYQQTGRPVYSAMGSMAASGGYYISAPADKIIANRNCWTGSIGVTIGTVFDFSQLLEKYGVRSVTITSGKNKAMGSAVDPLTKEQKAIYQSLVDEAYDQFTGIVAEGRKMSGEKVRKLADGRVYTAKQAKKNGLVDEIGTLEDAVADMQQQYGLKGCVISDMKYEDTSLFGSLLGFAAGEKNSKSDVSALLQMMQEQGRVPVSYMSEVRK